MKKFNLKQNVIEQSLAKEKEVYIGYFSLDDFKKLKYRSKRLDKTLCLKEIKWYPVFVNRIEWNFIPTKKYKLKGE